MDEDQRARLDALSSMLGEESLEGASAERRGLLEGIALLAANDLSGATRAFRRAQREGEEPFASLASVSLGECLKIAGKEGAALRAWRDVAERDEAPAIARRIAYLSLAVLHASRGDLGNEEAAIARAAEFEVE